MQLTSCRLPVFLWTSPAIRRTVDADLVVILHVHTTHRRRSTVQDFTFDRSKLVCTVGVDREARSCRLVKSTTEYVKTEGEALVTVEKRVLVSGPRIATFYVSCASPSHCE